MSGFKLGGMTFGSLFKKPETLRYPFEKKPAPAGLKGSVDIFVDACILCGVCQRTCPCNSIAVSKSDRTWTINRFSCIQCGSCVRACPKQCLTMDPDSPQPATAISAETFYIPEDADKKKTETDQP